jgi:hypothetical protein
MTNGNSEILDGKQQEINYSHHPETLRLARSPTKEKKTGLTRYYKEENVLCQNLPTVTKCLF